MDVKRAIEERRAYRSLAPMPIPAEMVDDLAQCAQLAPSCNNSQPARFVFVHDPLVLEGLKPAFNKGNEWCQAASMVIAVCAEREDGCVVKGREYYLFDTGLQTAHLILRATELGLVAHPIAGYKPEIVRQVLGIPEAVQVVTLVLVGRRAESISPVLSAQQVERERTRPERLPLEQVAFHNRWPEQKEKTE